MATAKKAPEIEESAAEFLMEELVTIKLPLTKDQQEPVYVRVNQNTFLIKRGHYVQVPRYAAEVIEHAEAATMKSMEFIEQHSTPVD